MTTTLLLDMDGPLADFDAHFWNVCSRRGHLFDIDSPADQAHRYFTDHILDPAERAEARALVDAPGWFAELPVTPGAQKGVENLLAAGITIWVCTKPLEANPTCLNDKHQWLVKNFPALSDRMITAPDKSMVHGDLLLDDAPKRAWIGNATWAPVIFDAPFNRNGWMADLPRWTWGEDQGALLAHDQDWVHRNAVHLSKVTAAAAGAWTHDLRKVVARPDRDRLVAEAARTGMGTESLAYQVDRIAAATPGRS